MKPLTDRKAVGSPISFASVRRNSGSSTTTTAMLNKLNNTSTICLNDASLLTTTTNNQGHRKLDRSLSEPVDRSSSAAQQQRNNQGNSSRYKTELCRPFEENGTCKYGDKCQFAHGAHELRTLARHPKYKTELCRTFHTTGFCPYGPRCHFIHNADESRKSVSGSSSSPPPSTMLTRDAPRPKALSIGSYSLGSTGDSPPSSLSESPTSMGSFFDGPFTGFSSSNPATPTITANSTFNYCKDINTAAFGSLQLNKQQIHHLNRALNQITLAVTNHRNSNFDSVDSVFHEPTVINAPGPEAPSSPVGSLISEMDNNNQNCGSPTCTSPLDVSRNLRLPIFSQLSISDD